MAQSCEFLCMHAQFLLSIASVLLTETTLTHRKPEMEKVSEPGNVSINQSINQSINNLFTLGKRT